MIWAVLGGVAIGVSLGLLGSGGSILTVPVLVYLVGQPEKIAIAGSLAIVGGIALSGAVLYARRGLVHWRSVVFFGIPGMVGTYGGAWLAKFVSGALQLGVFALVMLVASYVMLRPAPERTHGLEERHSVKIAADGVVVGVITGFVGVGGGFLIVPALVVVGGLPMHLAVGTSLTIIALKSASGFVKYLGVLGELGLSVDWAVIGWFLLFGVVGTIAGRRIGAAVPQAVLKRAFALFLIPVAVFILWQNVPKVL